MVTMVEQPLQRTTSEQQGIASSALLKFIEALDSQLHELHSVMLLRHGCVVAEGWWSPYKRETPHMLFSLSKSFTSTAVGLAVSEGHFSLDDTVISFFPDDVPAEKNDFLKAMRVRHLLSMSTGQAEDTMPHMGDREDGQWTRAFFEVPVRHEPGTHFLYNTGATYILSAIVQKTTGLKLLDYLTPRLLEPLDIKNATWQDSPEGIHTGGFGMNITTEDIARFGQLYLQKGLWNGRRILPEGWVEEATSAQVSNGSPSDPSEWTQGYGYQFWRCRHGAYRGDGAFGQYCVVMPEQDAVLAITGGVADMQQPLNLVWELLLPAMQSEALADDTVAHEALTHKLASLALRPSEGQPSSVTAQKVSGQTYEADTNEMNIKFITFDFTSSNPTVRIETAEGEETLTCGHNEWRLGQTALFNAPWEGDPYPVVTSGAWTGEETFTMIVRFHETPFFQTVVCRFDEENLTVETRVNVGFAPPQTIRVTAHAKR